jgi:hypothetical protein
MNDVKCEEHEGLMLLFMTTFFFLLLAAGMAVGSALSACHDCFDSFFPGEAIAFFVLETYYHPLRYHLLVFFFRGTKV